MANKKATNAEMMQKLEEMQKQFKAMQKQLEEATAKAEAAEAKAEAEAKKSAKAEAMQKQLEEKLLAEMQKSENEEFDKSIRPVFDWHLNYYAVAGLNLQRKTAFVPFAEVTFTASELMQFMQKPIRKEMQFKNSRSISYWATEEKSGEEFKADLNKAIMNRYNKANALQFVFPADKKNIDATSIKRALPSTAVVTKPNATTKSAVQRAKSVATGGQYRCEYDFTGVNRAIGSNRTIESVARGYMLKEDGKPVVRILVTGGGFKVATRMNIKALETVNDESALIATLAKYTAARAKEWK